MAQTQARAPLRAGAAQIDITPQSAVHLAGSVGEHRPARFVLDPLYAKAVVFEDNRRKLCFLALDVTIVADRYSATIRQAAAERFGFDPDSVMIHATQTHSAPPLGHFMVDEDFPELPAEFEWVRGGNESYSAFATERAIEAIGEACESMAPVRIGVGSGIEGRMAFNRRAVTRDGSIGMPGPTWTGGPAGPTWIRYMEGPIDPELGVMCVRSDTMSMMAIVVNYACHPVHVFPRPIVSADWPGAVAEELRKTYGSTCVPLILNGACGNINPWPPFDHDYVADHRRMGAVLAKTAAGVIESLTFSGDASLDFRVRHLPIPLRKLDPKELDWARGILEKNSQPAWTDETHTRIDGDWMTAASIYSVYLMRQRGPNLAYEIQILRVGNTAFVGLPGEPFVEAGLRIKLASPTYPTYIVHCTTHYTGYLPIKEGFKRGGHEVNTRYWAKLVPEALDMVVEAAVEALNDVFGS